MDALQNYVLSPIQQQLAWVSEDGPDGKGLVDWKLYVQGSSWVVCGWELYLLIRQYPLYSLTSPPPAVAAHIPQETFEKSQRYGKDKARVALFSKIYSQVVDSLMIHYDFYAWSWNASGALLQWAGYDPEAYEIVRSILFTHVLSLLSSLPSLPLSVYTTFVLEQAHGFNKTTPRLFITDLLTSYALFFALGSPFLYLFLKIFDWAADSFVVYVMALLIGFQMLMVLIYPTVIQPLFNKLTSLRDGPVRQRVEALARDLGFPLTHLYEIDGSKRSAHSNAYFFGLPWAKHIVIFDTLLKQSEETSTVASDPSGSLLVTSVLAHELGHWWHAHPSKMMAVSQLHVFGILAAFPAFLKSKPLLRTFGFPVPKGQRLPPLPPFLLFQLLLGPLEAAVGFGMNVLSRRFEWEADAFAVNIADTVQARLAKLAKKQNKNAEKDIRNESASLTDLYEKTVDSTTDLAALAPALSTALISLHVKNLATTHVDWMYSAWHHSHPTLVERLATLEAAVQKRDQKAQ